MGARALPGVPPSGAEPNPAIVRNDTIGCERHPARERIAPDAEFHFSPQVRSRRNRRCGLPAPVWEGQRFQLQEFATTETRT